MEIDPDKSNVFIIQNAPSSTFNKTKITVAILIVCIIIIVVAFLNDITGEWIDENGDRYVIGVKSYSGYSTTYAVDTYIFELPFMSSWITYTDSITGNNKQIYYDRFGGKIHMSDRGIWRKTYLSKDDSVLSWRPWINKLDTFSIEGMWVGVDKSDNTYVLTLVTEDNSTKIKGGLTQADVDFYVFGDFNIANGQIEDEFGKEWILTKEDKYKISMVDGSDDIKVDLEKIY